MSRFLVSVHIVPRKGILDPQGTAVATALHSLGFDGVRDALGQWRRAAARA